MGWTILLGVAVLAGLGAAATEFDNISLETSPSGFSRKAAPRPIFTASYGVAPGEYVLRGSDNSGHPPAPVHGFNFLPRDQAPPQEYLDLLRQTGAANGASPVKQQKGTSRVIDQQYFGIQPNSPYPASGPSPVPSSVPSQVQNARVVSSSQPNFPYPASGPSPVPSSGPSQVQNVRVVSSSPYPPTGQNQPLILNIAPIPQYPATGTSPGSALNVSPKPNTVSKSRSNQGSGSASAPGDTRQGSGKSVQLSYSLDYDLRTLHRIEESANRNSDSSSSSSPYYPSEPGTSVRGNEELLNQLAPRPPPIPFLSSYDSSQDRKKSKTKLESAENDKDKIEIIKLPSPKGQRPITQEEFLELVQAGYDITPVDNVARGSYQTTQQPPQRDYQRAKASENQLQLPKSRVIGSSPSRPVYLSTADFQDPIPQRQTYVTNPGTAPSAGGTASGYYQTPAVPLPLIRQQNVQPQVQSYQPGRSGIQQVQQQQQEQQNYQKQAEPQPQIYQTPERYVSQNFPSAAAEQQPQQEYNTQQQYTAGAQHTVSYPTAAAQQTQEYQQVSGQQALIYQQPSAPQVQIYQQPQTVQSQNEALSQPKEYIVPAPQRSKSYSSRVNQGYQQTSPSATGNEESLTYQQALGNIQQGYEEIPTALGASAAGIDIQRTQPRYGRRNSRRRQSSQHEAPITYIQRYEGDTTAYSKEQ